ncbi:transmembrane protein 131 [Caerostris extrusa]|uniref:Transmembrane protein 131 n=1 Tax=Caerostris extrusa TaxID=172846 RepID=A0AAV4V371_CAEEX|nr:transmembrane protein 131 [Caerostris extrusa]
MLFFLFRYTPDFSLTYVERTLNIHTSQGPKGQILQYKVVATIPRHMLSFCSGTLPRPSIELTIYYICIFASLAMLLAAILAHVDNSYLKHGYENEFGRKDCAENINVSENEEETSSTTTETSTTESDISEKDNRLPDVCITSKSQKNRCSKTKSRDIGVECNSQIASTKNFGGNILQPNTLELPYKPKAGEDEKDENVEIGSDDDLTSVDSETIKNDEDTLDGTNDQNQNFLPQVHISRDAYANNGKNDGFVCESIIIFGILKPNNSSKTKRSQNCHSLPKISSKQLSSFSTNAWNSENIDQLVPSGSDKKLKGSKLMNWMFTISSDCESNAL